MKSCMTDISKLCQHELNEVRSLQIESEGRVMFCLRRGFARKVTASSAALSSCQVGWLVGIYRVPTPPGKSWIFW